MNELSTLRNLAYEKSLLSSSICPTDKNTVQNLIVSRLPTHDKPLGKAAAHHFSKPGKMLRAKMAMHGADALQVNQTAAIRWAHLIAAVWLTCRASAPCIAILARSIFPGLLKWCAAALPNGLS